MVLVFIRHNPDGIINLFLIGKPIGFFQIKKQILHVRIVQGGTISVETDGLYNILAVGQDVVCDSPGKQRVTLEYGQAVPYGFGAIFGKITAIEPLKISRSISDRVDYPPIRLSCFGIISVSVRQFSPVSFLP